MIRKAVVILQNIQQHLPIRQVLQRHGGRLRQAWEQRLGGRRTHDSSTVLFRSIRRRLLMGYSSILATILLIAGIFLYLAMQGEIFRPVNRVNASAVRSLTTWWATTGKSPCDVTSTARPRVNVLFACYNAQGILIGSNRLAAEFPAFSQNTLARTTLTQNTTGDIVNYGSNFGAISRYASVVRDPQTQAIIGVIQSGVPVQGELQALNILVSLLAATGIITIIGASIGGLWLAERAMEPAHVSYRRQQQFISDVSHEIRTPLTLLRANAEVLLRDRRHFPQHDVELLDDIVNETDHLSRLASTLLQLARLDAQAIAVVHARIDLARVAQTVSDRIRHYAHEHHSTISITAAPAVFAIGDHNHLADAVLGLTENAIKYNPDGGTIHFLIRHAGERVQFIVQDTGPGIATEHLAHLGERFYRLDRARTRQVGGFGLGIAIAKELLVKMNGTLTFASTLGEGTQAIIELPQAPRKTLSSADQQEASL